MDINSNLNQNIESVSGVKSEDQKASIVSSLFSIAISNKELGSENELKEKEFIFKEEDVKIIEYLTHIIPEIKNNNKNFITIDMIKQKIETNQILNSNDKIKILNFLKDGGLYLKSINLNITENSTSKNKNLFTSKEKNIQISQKYGLSNPHKNAPTISNLNENKDFSFSTEGNKKKKLSVVNNLNDSKLNDRFVKNIKKNNHPNKIYKFNNTQNNSIEKLTFLESTDSNTSNFSENNNVLEKFQQSENLRIRNINHVNISSLHANQSNGLNNNPQNNDTTSYNNPYNSVLENLIDHLDLTQKGWTSKLASRIEKAMNNGREEIEFNLKPKNLGSLKVSVIFKDGVNHVKITTENSFVSSALNQNEVYLQKLFNDQGMNLEFTAQNENRFSGSKNDSNQNHKNEKEKKNLEKEVKHKKVVENINQNKSSRHMINVIA